VALSQRRAGIVGRLKARRTRRREGLVLVEGVRAVREALDAGAAVAFAIVSPRLLRSAEGRSLREALDRGQVVDVPDEELVRLADTESPQGVLVVVHEPGGGGSDFGGTRLLVLDAVQDPGNVGTLVRGAVAFGLDGVVCLDGTVDPWAAKAVRAAAGTTFRIPISTVPAPQLVARLEEGGIPLFAAAADGANVEGRRGVARFALAVGNEGAGVRAALLEAAVDVLAVPMRGPVESLNVGVAGSILMHVLMGGATE